MVQHYWFLWNSFLLYEEVCVLMHHVVASSINELMGYDVTDVL